MTQKLFASTLTAGFAAALLGAPALAAPLNITNAGFETDSAPAAGATGWTVTSTGDDWFTTNGTPTPNGGPPAAAEGSQWLTGDRQALDGTTGTTASANPQVIEQLVDISGDSALVDSGLGLVSLDFQYADADPNDQVTLTIDFFSDVAGTTAVGTSLTTGILADTASDQVWELRSLSGAVPVSARSLLIQISNTRQAGTSVGNVYFDDFSGGISEVPEPGSLALIGLGAFACLRRRR